jgi:hypothetical protein
VGQVSTIKKECINPDVEPGNKDDGNVTRSSLDTEDKLVTKENAIGEDGKYAFSRSR